MVGDTLEADVVGAHNVGMVTVWIDRSKKRISGKIKPDHTIADVSQLLQILDR
jgi:FMN phosphatase YigB (HAD superfamily)